MPKFVLEPFVKSIFPRDMLRFDRLADAIDALNKTDLSYARKRFAMIQWCEFVGVAMTSGIADSLKGD